MSKRLATLAMAALAFACGGGPGTDDTDADADALSGAWELQFSVADSELRCSANGVQLTLDQRGPSFSGQITSAFSLVCPQSIGPYGGAISEGVIGNSIVSFNFRDVPAELTGEISRNSMSGVIIWHGDDAKVLTGSWSATRP